MAIVDGEHYPAVVRDALDELEDDVVAAVLVGGTEKLRGGELDYGVPLVPSLEVAVERHAPDVVLDLSDEPVLGPRERFALASRALALGVPYEGPDFRFEPPTGVPSPLPTLAVIGTGERTLVGGSKRKSGPSYGTPSARARLASAKRSRGPSTGSSERSSTTSGAYRSTAASSDGTSGTP